MKNEQMVRQRLLAAALDLFVRKGYAATTVREIVAAAGVSKPALYYYFTSKEGIYLEMMTRTFALFQGIVDQISDSQGPTRERIIHFATMIFDSVLENIEVVRLIYAIFFGPPQGTPHFPHDHYFTTMLAVIGNMAQEGIAAGEFRKVEVDDVAWTIVSAMNTIMEEQICHVPPRADRARLLSMLNLYLDGIAGGERT